MVIKQGMEGGISSSSRFKRSLKERERRLNMKKFYSHLSSLLPPRPKKMPVLELVDEAREYVKQMQKRIEQLKQTKLRVEEECKAAKILPRMLPQVINIRDSDSTLEVNLVTRAGMKFELRDFIIVLEEEGAKIISVMYQKAGDRFICSIQSQAICSRIGIATSRLRKRLEGLIS